MDTEEFGYLEAAAFDKAYARMDWDKIEKYMVDTGWEWTSCNGIPSVCDMKARVKELFYALQLSCKKRHSMNNRVSQGGFHVTKIRYENTVMVYIDFSIESHDDYFMLNEEARH